MKPRRVEGHKTCLFCSFLEALILLVEEVIFGDAHLNIWNDTRLFLNGYPISPCSVLKWKIEPTRAAVPENSSSKRASGWLIKIFFGTEQPHIEVPFPHKYLDTGLRASWLGRTRPKCEDVVGVAVLKLRDRDSDLRLRDSFILRNMKQSNKPLGWCDSVASGSLQQVGHFRSWYRSISLSGLNSGIPSVPILSSPNVKAG